MGKRRRKNIPGVKKKATLENRSAGVKSATFRRFICLEFGLAIESEDGLIIRYCLCPFIKYSMSSKCVSRRTYQKHFKNGLQDRGLGETSDIKKIKG